MPYRINQYYEKQYSTEIGFDGDEDALFNGWVEQSEQARQQLDGQLNLPYGDATRETIDLFLAEDSTRWLVFIHGGYWRGMTTGHFHFMVAPLLQAGWNVALPEYNLAPAVSIHTIVDQCRRAIAWLAAQQRNRCDEIIITGHSAGGHLTGMMWTTDWAAFGMDAALISGGIAISSLFDLDPLAHTKRNEDLKLAFADVEQLSPARLLPQISAPLVITVGGNESDEFQRQNALLRGIPQWATITGEPLSIPGYHHYNILEPLVDMDSPMWTTLRAMQA